MRRLLSLVVVGMFASSCAPTVNVEQEKTALLARDADWSKSTTDLDKMAGFFAPDAEMQFAGMPNMKGVPAIKAGLGPMMKAPGFKVSWKAASADVGGDVGYTTGTYEVTA